MSGTIQEPAGPAGTCPEVETSSTLPSDCRVLVAEDDFLTAMLLEDMLLTLGAERVEAAGSLEDALEIAESRTFDVATLDVNLGGALSYAAAERLRERGVPFVFITAYQDLPDCPEALREAPRISKPFSLATLSRGLATALAAG